MMDTDNKTLRNFEAFRPQIESVSTRGKITIAGLVLIILFGLYALYVQMTKGHIVTGMRDYVIWGLYIVNFIFFIGISYAGALISGILHLLRVPWRTPIIRMAETITVISTIIGPCYILLCIGRLDRLHHLLLFGRIQSPIAWDVIAITTYLTGSIIFLYLASIRDLAYLRDHPVRVARWRNKVYKFMAAGFRDTPKQRALLNQVTDLLSIVIIPLAILVHSVLAWIFGMTLRPGWHSTIFAPYFVVAAVYSGTGVLIVVMWVFRKIYHLESYITKIHFTYLGILLMILGALYGYFTFSEYLTSWYGSVKWDMEVLYRLFDPSDYWWWFFFAAFVGVLLPIIIVATPRFRNINSIAFAAMIAVMALWIKRYLIIIPTLEAPLLPMHDLRPEFVHYSPTWVEWALTLSGVATFLLLFYLFSKFIPIIPVVRVGEERDYSKLRMMAKERFLRRMMKQLKREKKAVVSVIILVCCAASLSVRAQEPVKSRLKLEFANKSGMRSLSVRITARIDDKTAPLPDLKIRFYALADTAKELLGEMVTSEEGRASVEIPCGKTISKDKEGKSHYLVSFSGTREYMPAESEVSIRDVVMQMTFFQKDSTKLIRVQAMEIGSKGDTIPVEGPKITFYVPRTFSNLKIGEGPVKNGQAELDFPVTLPGDSIGDLPVIARFEDNEDYGNAEVSATINWGKPLPPMSATHRGLGDVDAPLWMVYTLIILLSLVWFHYLYAVITVFRIRYLGKKAETEATLSNPINP
jgi:Ni/Fe-hydrogenase subunit HybB-like protein